VAGNFHSCCRQRGVTLVEMLIVVVLLGIMGAWGSTMLSHNFRTAHMVNSNKASADQVRFAMERLSRELRGIKYSNGYSITSALAPASTSITFTRTINGADVTITITKTGTDLKLAYSSPSANSIIASNVSAFTLDFYTVDPDTGTVSATTQATELSYIVMSLTMSDTTNGQAMTERTRITMRSS
jgi:prepilin-type N-terminal cleavage/methylation domain-containing protein